MAELANKFDGLRRAHDRRRICGCTINLVAPIAEDFAAQMRQG